MHAAARRLAALPRHAPVRPLQLCSTLAAHTAHAPVSAASNGAPRGSPRRLQSTQARVKVAPRSGPRHGDERDAASAAAAALPNAALFERVSRPSGDAASSAAASDADAADEHVVWHHRPNAYAPVKFKTFQHNSRSRWREMDRGKFRVLLEDCMATGVVSPTLRTHLDEFPIMQYDWSHQELVLLVGALIKGNRSKAALALLRHQIRGAPGDRNRLNRVAAESARLGNATVAVGILHIARHFGIEPDVVTYTSAIHACARGSRDRISRAFQLLEEMVDAKVEPNHRTYGAVVLAYARLNRWEDIEDFLEALPYDAELTKSDVFASAITTCSRNRQFVVAAKLFAMLVDEGLYLGEKVSNAALSACARTSDLEQMDKIMAFIEAHSKPSIYSYNTMISAYGNAGRMDDALAVYERIQERERITPDLVTFNALILGARRSRRADLLPSILSNMAAHQIKWDVYTLNGLLESCQLTGDVARANAYWEQAIHEQDLRRDRVNFETLMGVYYEAGDYEAVIKVWRDDLVCRRRAKSAKSFNYLLRACSKLGDVETATSLFDEFIERGQVPTAIAHNHILSTYLKAGDFDGAQRQLQVMASEPSLATVFGFTAVMKYALKKQQFQDVLDVFEEFEATRDNYASIWSPQLQFPSDAVYVLAAQAAVELHDHDRLVKLYQALPFSTTPVTVKTEVARLVMASCEREEDWRCAVSLYDELSRVVDDDTNVEFYEIVVKVVARAGEFERALDVNGGDWYRQNRPDQGWF